jgi:hypothetical protein
METMDDFSQKNYIMDTLIFFVASFREELSDGWIVTLFWMDVSCFLLEF